MKPRKKKKAKNDEKCVLATSDNGRLGGRPSKRRRTEWGFRLKRTRDGIEEWHGVGQNLDSSEGWDKIRKRKTSREIRI